MRMRAGSILLSPRPSRVREWLSGPAFFAGRLGTQTALTKRYGVPPTSDPKIEASQARTNRCRKLGASQRENILFYLYSYQTNGHTPSVLGGIAGGRACPGYMCVCVQALPSQGLSAKNMTQEQAQLLSSRVTQRDRF